MRCSYKNRAIADTLGTDFDHLVQLGKEQRKQLSSGYELIIDLINDYVWLRNEMVGYRERLGKRRIVASR